MRSVYNSCFESGNIIFTFLLLCALQDDRESVSSCGSNASARTHGSTRSSGSRNPPRPSSVARLAPTGSGAISEADFEKAFSSNPRINVSLEDWF